MIKMGCPITFEPVKLEVQRKKMAVIPKQFLLNPLTSS